MALYSYGRMELWPAHQAIATPATRGGAVVFFDHTDRPKDTGEFEHTPTASKVDGLLHEWGLAGDLFSDDFSAHADGQRRGLDRIGG